MTDNNGKTSRREFITQTGLVAAGISLGAGKLSAARYNGIIGSGEKIRVGFIGVGNRGTQLLHAFMEQPNVEVAALCDVYEPYVSRDYSAVLPRYIKEIGNRIPRMEEKFPGKVDRYSDYRKMLEDKTIDAVCIATPDHWHALQTLDAIGAGKDVYVEKPLSKTIAEGRAMVEGARQSKQIVAVGLNRRGASLYQKLAREIPAGKIGKVTYASACHVSNMFPMGIGKLNPENPPADFDWDMWLGPREYRPYQYNIAP